jgi:hypothetical protein
MLLFHYKQEKRRMWAYNKNKKVENLYFSNFKPLLGLLFDISKEEAKI